MHEPHADTSRFLSYVLRHAPQDIGLALDRDGWADLDALIAGAAAAGHALDRALIAAVVAGSAKQRFALSGDGLRIRAVQGHSTPTVALQHRPAVPPDVLYHGTAQRFLASIMAAGLQPGQRHHVHLSATRATAVAVGRRHGSPVVLEVDAARLHRQGIAFFQADNGVWLSGHIPAGFLTVLA